MFLLDVDFYRQTNGLRPSKSMQQRKTQLFLVLRTVSIKPQSRSCGTMIPFYRYDIKSSVFVCRDHIKYQIALKYMCLRVSQHLNEVKASLSERNRGLALIDGAMTL
jgi:hypothetical protein